MLWYIILNFRDIIISYRFHNLALKINLKQILIFLIAIRCLTSISFSQDDLFSVELKNGNTITGKLLFKDETSLTLQTEFGELVIPTENIQSINNLESDSKENIVEAPHKETIEITQNSEIKKELNQEARWRTIYAAMGIGNTIYGAGIPYLLDWDQTDNKTTGFRYIVFGATYYVSSAYTENMDLPLGRSYMQYAGASLGFFSILPLTSIIGIENWSEIDPDGKVSTVYSMVSVPYGVITADRLYKKWDLNNGQSYLVSLGVNLGILNTVGLIQQTEWAEWAKKNPENFWRWTSSLTYSGALLGGYLAKNMAIKTSSITEGDVGFLNASMNLGIFNSFLLGSLIDFDNYKSQTLLTMAGVNGFLYLGSHLNKSYGSLSQGQEKIVILGMAASYLAWIGCALVTDFDYASDAARVLDMASLTGGWYFSRRSLKKENSGLGHNDHGSVKSLISFYPQLVRQNNLLVPGVGFSIRF